MKTDLRMDFAALLRSLDHWWSKQQIWSEHFTLGTMCLSSHFVETIAQREAGMCPWCTCQGVRKWQLYAPGSRSLQEGATTAGGEGDGTKQPTGDIWILQYSVHRLTRPRKYISFQLSRNNRTPNAHLPKQNWTIIIMNIKTSIYPSQGMTKGNTQDLPSRKVRQNMVLQGYMSRSMLLSCNLKQIFDPSDTHNC